MALLRDINRVLGWELPTQGPKTLSGLVLEHLEAIPENNLCLRLDDYLIETLQIKDNVIKSLKVDPRGPACGASRLSRTVASSQDACFTTTASRRLLHDDCFQRRFMADTTAISEAVMVLRLMPAP